MNEQKNANLSNEFKCYNQKKKKQNKLFRYVRYAIKQLILK